MSNQSPKITLVGHCRPDIFMLTAAIRGFFPNAEVLKVNSQEELAEPSDLFLVNRVLDGSFSSDSGIDLIKNLPADSPPAMLITNFEDAAAQAIEAGAVPGFGKSDIRSPKAQAALSSALNIESE